MFTTYGKRTKIILPARVQDSHPSFRPTIAPLTWRNCAEKFVLSFIVFYSLLLLFRCYFLLPSQLPLWTRERVIAFLSMRFFWYTIRIRCTASTWSSFTPVPLTIQIRVLIFLEKSAYIWFCQVIWSVRKNCLRRMRYRCVYLFDNISCDNHDYFQAGMMNQS